MRVIVCGSRDWNERQVISDRLAELPRVGDTVVVHGAARGVDRMAGQEADKLGLLTDPYPADWDGYPADAEEFKRFGKKGAGRKRNEYMAYLGADLCIAFWDGTSTGTRDMVDRATAHGIPVEILGKQGERMCLNRCTVDDENRVLPDGYCQSCHEYPEGS